MSKSNIINAVRFFEQDYVNQASYDNLRKIASLVDGLKNASRKVIHTVLDKKITELTKVSQLSSKAAEYADYLHGSLDGVVVTLGQDYLTTNQIPLLKRKGNFGTRAIPEASASRYIFAAGNNRLREIFLDIDKPLLVNQTFEGTKIEPMYFTPELPILLVNGSKGVSSGFAQNILARPVDSIVQCINVFLESGEYKALELINKVKPYIGNFNGKVERDPENPQAFKWLFTANFTIDKNVVTILDIPYGSDLRSYLQHLDKLDDDKKFKKYEDCSDGDNFKFVVTFDKKTTLTKDQVIKMFKLQTSITENFTCMDENNKIFEAETPFDILKRYVDIKLAYFEKRKALILENLKIKMSKDQSILWLINEVINNKIDFKKLKASDLNKLFKQNELYQDPNDSQEGFGYLHRIPMGKMVKEEVQSLEAKIKQTKQEIKQTEKTTIQQMWSDNLANLTNLTK